MTADPSRNMWLRKQQCPCGDWKCYVTHEGEGEIGQGTTLACSQLGNEKSDATSSCEGLVTPYVGMVFKSDDDAFEYYGNFARKNGFSIRKERSRLSPQLGVYKRDFVCYRSGFAPPRKKVAGDLQRDRKSVRCGCDAKMYLSKEAVNGVSQWLVVQFSNVHNHELLEDEQVRLLPAYRKIQEADQERILLLSKAGYPVHRIVKLLELEKGVHGGQLPFLERDVRNFVQNRKKIVQENDALVSDKTYNDSAELLECFKAMKEANENFLYEFSLDGNDKVDNIAWTNRESVFLYSMFGDAVLFDTSYQSIAYGATFGAWLGIDNNGRVVLFGCVLLQDETPLAFSWALQTFLRFMSGKYPQTILTDIDPRLQDAIRGELPNAKHVIPAWCILPKMSCWFSSVLGPTYSNFRSEFDVVYRMESAEQFDYEWGQLVARFGLISEKHSGLMFSLRESWALPYIRGYFLARMETSAYSKLVHMFLEGLFSAHTCFHSFLEQIMQIASAPRQAYEDVQGVPVRTCIPIEEHARDILAPFAFSVFQQELALAMQYAISEMSNGSCLVEHYKKMDGERLVIWVPEGEQIHCSCKEFESSGILCRHALRVLLTKNYFQLHEMYLPRRWRQIQNDGQPTRSDGWFQEYHNLVSTLFAESVLTKERSDFVRKELTKELCRLLDQVRSMPVHELIPMDTSVSPTD